jgi:hypothetical protein
MFVRFKDELPRNGCHSHFYDVNERPGKVRPRPRPVKTTEVNGIHFWTYPVDYTRDPTGENGILSAEGAAALADDVANWEADLAAEVALRKAAIDAHIAHVTAGVETAIFAISAHGSPCEANGKGTESCGVWGVGYGIIQLDRSSVEGPLYRAARCHTCEHLVYDDSCSSGCTVRNGDNLNNRATASCKENTVHDHCIHAAYEGDLWMSSLDSLNGTVGSDTGWDQHQALLNTLRRAQATPNPRRIIPHVRTAEFGGSYQDEGYGVMCPNACSR